MLSVGRAYTCKTATERTMQTLRKELSRFSASEFSYFIKKGTLVP